MNKFKEFQQFPAWTVSDTLKRTAAQSPDATFFTHPSFPNETYATFLSRSEALARHLTDFGLENGDRLGILAPNGLPALHGWMASALGGFVDVTLNSTHRGDPLLHALELANPKALLVHEDLLDLVLDLDLSHLALCHIIVIGRSVKAEMRSGERWHFHFYEDLLTGGDGVLVAPRFSDIASIIFTSGTTGPAKAALLPHAQVALLAWISASECKMTNEDRFFVVHPLNHIAGKFMAVLATIATGGTVCMHTGFNAKDWINQIHETGATITIAHGPMIEMIYNNPRSSLDDSHGMRRMMCCPLPKSVGNDFSDRFNLMPIEMWGMTEVGCPIWTSQQQKFVPGSCGKILSEWYEMKVLDPETDIPLAPEEVGEFCVRPRVPWTAMQGYANRPEAFVSAWRNQWFHSGDSGYIDEEGNFFFVDRMGDRIRRRAENISSYEIETTANTHPDIRESAAIGIPSEYEGDEDILLIVVPGDLAPSPLDLLKFLVRRLPHFMVPRYIRFVSEMPRTPTNKIRKQVLRSEGLAEDIWDRTANNVSLRELVENSN